MQYNYRLALVRYFYVNYEFMINLLYFNFWRILSYSIFIIIKMDYADFSLEQQLALKLESAVIIIMTLFVSVELELINNFFDDISDCLLDFGEQKKVENVIPAQSVQP